MTRLLEVTLCTCRECAWIGPVSAIAKCGECGSKYLRTITPSEEIAATLAQALTAAANSLIVAGQVFCAEQNENAAVFMRTAEMAARGTVELYNSKIARGN